MGVVHESLAELFEQYKDEVRETMGILDNELVAIEQDPSNSEVIFSLFRHLHSLKGSSKMFNVDNIGHIAHKLEDLMQLIDKDNSILGRHPQIVELLFKGNDIFREVMTRLEADINYVNLTPEHAQFIEEINAQLELINRSENVLVAQAQVLLDELNTILPDLEEAESAKLRRAMEALAASVNLLTLKSWGDVKYSYGGVDITACIEVYEYILQKFKTGDFTPENIETFFQNADELIQTLFEVAEEGIMGVLGELDDGLRTYREKSLEIDSILIEFFTEMLADIKTQVKIQAEREAIESGLEVMEARAVSAPSREDRLPAEVRSKTIRVDEKKIDLFLNSVGNLITQSEILNHLQYSFQEAGINPSAVRDFAAVNRTISNDIVSLQKSIMEVRQVEIDNILKKFPRLVRDISHDMGKEVQLVVSGERTPIDKSLLDDVEAALIHVVRNAIDHGLETPKQREGTGKDRRGRIRIMVSQGESSVLIEVSDDGRGVNYDAVREKALERRLLSREKLQTMDDKETEALLFLPGLSTKAEATDISGRGVGLDVVMSNVKKWNGQVTLENQPGQGLALRMVIPITHTLLTKEAIMLKLGDSTFCLPLENVLEIVSVPKEKLHRHKTHEIFQHRDQIISVVDIKGLLGIPPLTDDENRDKTFIIVRGRKEARKAILADAVLGKQTVVLKDFEVEGFRKIPYYQGFTLRGDGRVVIVLDAEKIVE